jgi:hypothetical protein
MYKVVGINTIIAGMISTEAARRNQTAEKDLGNLLAKV